ncbi:MAG: GntR family transcriptional regulator [Paracoccus sp. (in: a-proteobacteria)]|nr:GntR family transcriptional regulator [Paracoccus sp. (in: a-proteobacteria)]
MDQQPERGAPDTPGASLHDTLVADLRGLVVEGHLRSGQRVPEAALCQRFGISRTPLREALKVIAAEGFVHLRPNRGAVVAPLDADEIGQIFELKGALERLIGRAVPDRAGPADIAALDALHADLGRAVDRGDLAVYSQLNHDFHQHLADLLGNPLLSQTYDTLQKKIWRCRMLVNAGPERLHASYAEHEAIMIAIRARTPRDLAARLVTHNDRTCAAMRAAVAHELARPRPLPKEKPDV